jgi:hypothetical protein
MGLYPQGSESEVTAPGVVERDMNPQLSGGFMSLLCFSGAIHPREELSPVILSEGNVPPGEPGDTGRLVAALGRAHQGPVEGTHIITIEVPATIDEDKAYDLYVALNAIMRTALPGTFTTWHRVMPHRGKHGSGEHSAE